MAWLILLLGGRSVLAQEVCYAYDGLGRLIAAMDPQGRQRSTSTTPWHEPLKAARIMNRVRDMRGGQENDPHFGTRMRGTGIFAEVIRNRFDLACKRHGLTRSARALDTSKFNPPGAAGRQMTLF